MGTNVETALLESIASIGSTPQSGDPTHPEQMARITQLEDLIQRMDIRQKHAAIWQALCDRRRQFDFCEPNPELKRHLDENAAHYDNVRRLNRFVREGPL